MRFSIIVPVYNVEEYIEKCLKSIEDQTFRDYEVIVVDDETPDNSMALVQTFVDRHPEQFRTIHQKNKGLGGARNTGVAAAQGEYLLFLDSDDYIPVHALETLDKRLTDCPCDMIFFNYTDVSVSGETIFVHRDCDRDVLLQTTEEKKELLSMTPSACSKAFLRSFYLQSGVSFPERTLYEDAITRILTARASSIQLCTESLYYYVQRPGSIMNGAVSPRVMEIRKAVDLVYDAFVSQGLMQTYQDAIEAALIGSVLYVIHGVNCIARNQPYQKALIHYIEERFPDYQSNPVLDQGARSKIDCLKRERYGEYYCRFHQIPQIKLALLRIPLVRKLNDLRKRT